MRRIDSKLHRTQKSKGLLGRIGEEHTSIEAGPIGPSLLVGLEK